MQQFEEERNELQDQIRSLEEENQKYLDKIIKNSKEAADLYEKQRDPANANGNVDSGHKNGLIDTAEKMVNTRISTCLLICSRIHTEMRWHIIISKLLLATLQSER